MIDDEAYEPMLSNDAFEVALDRLNAICGLGSRWQQTTSVKKHIDVFGVEVRRGEKYYKRQYSDSFSATLKLSRQSMDRLLFVTTHTCPTLEQFADLLLDEQRSRLMKLRDQSAKK